MFYADLHIHSRFSRATSKSLDLRSLALWAQIKGIQVVGTGDCLHPGWLKELREQLEPAEDGLFRLKPEYGQWSETELPAACRGNVRFLLTTEIANIYKKMDRVRKIHNVLFFPSFDAAEQVRARLDKIGNLHSDGRPILGMDSRDLLEMTLESDPLSFLVPAHIWTPWFSVLGSKGGFDAIDDCYGDLTEHIFAVETGLSSDPPMNWRLSELDRFVMMSNSDAHSPAKLGREATLFDTEISYSAMYAAMKNAGDGLLGTLEFYPQEGKYHYDGHRACDCRLHPRESIEHKGLCPVCGRPVTVGVMARVEELADHPEGRKSPKARPYYSLVPLPEIIAAARGCGVNTKAVNRVYRAMLAGLGNEFSILRDIPLKEIADSAGPFIAEGVRRVRAGELDIAPGYDGEYGQVNIFSEQERAEFHA
ncbi:MAG: endonuclease Q family protein [Candidatus Omnitrophota bacterium]